MHDNREAVLKGATLLDERIPAWRGFIDWDLLDIGRNANCVIGQIAQALACPEFEVLKMIGLHTYSGGRGYGFEVPANGSYAALTDAWKKAAKERGANV